MDSDSFSPQFISFSNLTKIDTDKKRKFNVFAYLLNRDLIKPDGKIDDLNSVIINFGSYNSYESAKAFVETISKISNYPGIVITEFGKPYFLTTNPEMNYDHSEDISKLEGDFYSELNDEFERRKDLKKEIDNLVSEEYNPDSINYFASQCFLISKNQTCIDEIKKQVSDLESKIKHHQDQLSIRKHNAKKYLESNPDGKDLVLETIKNRLVRSGEFNLFEQFKNEYEKIKDQL